MKNGVVSIAIFIFLLGCSNDDSASPNKELVEPVVAQELINWPWFSDQGFKNLSFPVWFNDSVILQKKIKSLEFHFHDDFINDEDMFEDSIPNKSFALKFKDGSVNRMVVSDYSAEVNISEQQFTYLTAPDSLGYAEPTIINKVIYQDNIFIPAFATVQNAQEYDRLEFVKEDSTTIQFKNTLNVNQQKHIFIKDSINWNVLFIDQKFDLPKRHIYYYGIPSKYSESFQIRNLVKKTQLTKYKYFENDCVYQASTFNNGLENRRTFSYDSSGRVVGYIDSLIAAPDDFIEKKVTKIEYEKELPITISTYKERDTLRENPTQTIRFDYVFHK